MADVSVRPAGPDDVADIARVQLLAWQVGYADLLPAAVLAALSETEAADAWRPAITAAPTPRHRVLVAQEQDWVVGFVAFGPADPDDDTDVGTISLGPLLVEPRWVRRGHGSRLLAAAVDLARADGMRRAVTWIPEADATSREFLTGAGWALDGLVRGLDTGAGELREVRLHTDIGD